MLVGCKNKKFSNTIKAEQFRFVDVKIKKTFLAPVKIKVPAYDTMISINSRHIKCMN